MSLNFLNRGKYIFVFAVLGPALQPGTCTADVFEAVPMIPNSRYTCGYEGSGHQTLCSSSYPLFSPFSVLSFSSPEPAFRLTSLEGYTSDYPGTELDHMACGDLPARRQSCEHYCTGLGDIIWLGQLCAIARRSTSAPMRQHGEDERAQA